MEQDCECREYTFSELSETAKQSARNKYTSGDYPHDEWWDNTYEDANYIAKVLGLDIESTKTGRNGKSYVSTDIYFSGFCSQGDGACFKGYYRFNPEAVNVLNFESRDDKELIRIATELTTMQMTQRLLGNEYFGAKITISGRYSHSHSMDYEMTSNDSGDEREPEETDENQFGQLMRDFADHIYKSLEAEHDYLMSDEVVDEHLAEEKFDVDGVCL